MCTANCLSVHLTEAVGSDLACLDQFYERLDASLNGHFRVDTRGLEEINGLNSIEYSQTFIYGRPEVFWTGLWRPCGAIISPLDAEHDARGILRVLGKVVLEELKRVGVWRTVECSLSRVSAENVWLCLLRLPYGIPECRTIFQGCLLSA